jgi:transposase
VAKNRAQSQTRLRSARRAELIADYEAGMPVKAISAKYGVHRGTIPALVRRAGAEVRVAGLDAEERARASALYESGMTLVQVARRMGIGDDAVRQAVLDEGGQLRPRGRRPRATTR